MKSKQWATFLRIPDPGTTDQVPALDPGWCQAKGVNAASPVILRLLKQHVVPLVNNPDLEAFHFLIHDRQSGVPTDEKDRSAFIHLRLFFKGEVEFEAPSPFEMTRSVEDDGETPVSGIDYDIVAPGAPMAVKNAHVNHILCELSAWVVAMLWAHEWTDDAAMVRQMRQMLHWLGNMTQMNILLGG